MIASLEVFGRCLGQVTYGEKVRPSTDWLLRVVRALQEEDLLPHEMTPAGYGLRVMCSVNSAV
jgi:hypothetical protein